LMLMKKKYSLQLACYVNLKQLASKKKCY